MLFFCRIIFFAHGHIQSLFTRPINFCPLVIFIEARACMMWGRWVKINFMTPEDNWFYFYSQFSSFTANSVKTIIPGAAKMQSIHRISDLPETTKLTYCGMQCITKQKRTQRKEVAILITESPSFLIATSKQYGLSGLQWKWVHGAEAIFLCQPNHWINIDPSMIIYIH